MNPKNSIQAALIAAFAFCLALVFAVQIVTRVYIELPGHIEQEHLSDVHETIQLKNAISQIYQRKSMLVSDNSQWQATYDFIAADPDSETYQDYFIHSYDGYSYSVDQISGWVFYRKNGDIVFESHYDFDSYEPLPPLKLPIEEWTKPGFVDLGDVPAGLAFTSKGPLIYSVAQATNEDLSAEPNGFVVIWLEVNDGLIQRLNTELSISVTFLPVDENVLMVEEVLGSDNGVLKRNEQGQVHWILSDIFGEPRYLVRHQMPPRTFDDQLVSASGIVGFSASFVLLLTLSIFLSRYIVAPLRQTAGVVEQIAENNEFNRRVASGRTDELGALSDRFDELLSRVQQQEGTLKQQNTELEELAETDALTGIYNRRFFDKTLDLSWRQAIRTRRPIACMMIDVDHFKSYNDSHGHQAGDDALRSVASALAQNTTRATEFLCRYGGEEFVVLQIDSNEAASRVLAHRLTRQIEALKIPHGSSNCSDFITISVGLAVVNPVVDVTVNSLIEQADEALYKAKVTGRNKVVEAATKTN